MSDLENPQTKYQSYLANRIKSEGLSGRVTGIGFLESQNQVRANLAEHDVLLTCSRVETWNHTLLEGFAVGIPVVASDIPVHREVAGGAAWLVSPDDPNHLAVTIERIGHDGPEVTAKLDRGREVLSGLSWEKHAHDLLEALRQAANY